MRDYVELPLDETDAAKVSICGSLILNGHKVSMLKSPSLIWRVPMTPNTCQVTLTLTFEDDYCDNWARRVIGEATTLLTGCTFPRKGPIPDKSIQWGVSSALEFHGSYDVTQPITDVNDKAFANWRTSNQRLPDACHTFDRQRDAVGATEAVVSGLLEGWGTLETVVNFLNPNRRSGRRRSPCCPAGRCFWSRPLPSMLATMVRQGPEALASTRAVRTSRYSS